MGQFTNFTEMLTKIHVNIIFYKSLEEMPFYSKFMKEFLFGRHKLKYDKNIASRFIIPCFIGSLTINHSLCDLGASIKLMSLSMMKKINCREPKSTHMTMTLAYRSITYPYGVIKYELARVDDLLFPTHFCDS